MAKQTTETRKERLRKALARARRAHGQLERAKEEFDKATLRLLPRDRVAMAKEFGFEDLHDIIKSLGC